MQTVPSRLCHCLYVSLFRQNGQRTAFWFNLPLQSPRRTISTAQTAPHTIPSLPSTPGRNQVAAAVAPFPDAANTTANNNNNGNPAPFPVRPFRLPSLAPDGGAVNAGWVNLGAIHVSGSLRCVKVLWLRVVVVVPVVVAVTVAMRTTMVLLANCSSEGDG